MTKLRPYVLSIAGYDPSGGAGVLADVKTFEAIGVHGFAVTTCITYQNDQKFDGINWLSKKKIKNQLYPLLDKYKIDHVKIGLIKNLETLSELMELLRSYNKKIHIMWDPVISATSGYTFHKKLSQKYLYHIFQTIDLLTPNWNEIKLLTGEEDAIKAARAIAEYCNVFLKGGHSTETPGTDLLWKNKKLVILKPNVIAKSDKHGTGCVLSAAITAYLALGNTLERSCGLAKEYTYQYLISNETRLGYHK